MGRSFVLPAPGAIGVPVLASLGALLGAVLLAAPVHAASTGPTPVLPQNDVSIARLMGVASVSPTDAWAVGDVQVGNQKSTLIEHWDGLGWQQVTSPSPGGMYGSELTGVTAIAADDVWAAGSYHSRSTGLRTLVLHWDGTHWSQVPSPNPSATGDNVLSSIGAVSADDVWAVGWHTSPEIGAVTLTEHWDGVGWSERLSPNPSHRFANVLSGVSGVSEKDVWTVGSYSSSATETSTLVASWNGRKWFRPLSPNPGRLTNELLGVSARSAEDVWAVGSYSDLPGQTRSLIERWNGRRWLKATGPDLGEVNSVLTAVSAETNQDVWAVGYQEIGGTQTTLIEHWDGNAWTVVASPSPGVFATQLRAVTAGGPDSAWAVGTAFASTEVASELITAWNGVDWRIR